MNRQIQEWLFAAALVSSLVSMAGRFVAVASQRSQLAVQIMLQYSEKFRLILLAMPLEILATRQDLRHTLEPSPELSRHAFSLFFIPLELHYLHEKTLSAKWHLEPLVSECAHSIAKLCIPQRVGIVAC